ncbi:MAG: penicillin-binding protein activator [Deltaproteobacteria bacterium]|nr:penicillin-binding protein activator [Deltaproteobacteria bacterium]
MIGILLFVGACAEKPMPTSVAPPVPEDTASESELWTLAEKLFQSKEYGRALEAYMVFMARFPDSPHNDAALMKIGASGRLSGNDADACRAYHNLTEKYPNSLFLLDALLEILTCLYNEGRYGDTLEKAAVIREKFTLPEQKTRLEVLVGDTYAAMQEPVEAFYHYAAAFDLAREAAGQDLSGKLEKTANYLETTAIQSLLYRLENDVSARGYLLYQLGLNRLAEEKEGAALAALSELVDSFPEHEYAADADLLIEKIKRRSCYQPKRVGCLLPLTGRYKSYGKRALHGIELAMSTTGNSLSSILPHLIIKDSGSNPEKAVAAVKELAKEGVAAIIGPMTMAEAASGQAQLSQVPIIVFSQKNRITGIGDYVFRNFLTSEMQVKSLASHAFDRLEINNVAILYPNEKYGSTFMQLFWDEVIAHGGQVVGVESYDPHQTDFADAIKKLTGLYYEPSDLLKEELEQYKQEDFQANDPGILTNMTAVWAPNGIFDFGPSLFPGESTNRAETSEEVDEEPVAIVDFDAVFIPDAPNTAGLIIPQLAFYDIKDVYLLGTNLWHSNHLIKMAGEFLQGSAVVAGGFFKNRNAENVKQFSHAFQKAFKTSPGFIEAIAYDTARMVFETLGHCQICLRSDVRDRILNISGFNGVTGLTAFDQSGEAVREPFLLTIKGRRFIDTDEGGKN